MPRTRLGLGGVLVVGVLTLTTSAQGAERYSPSQPLGEVDITQLIATDDIDALANLQQRVDGRMDVCRDEASEAAGGALSAPLLSEECRELERLEDAVDAAYNKTYRQVRIVASDQGKCYDALRVRCGGSRAYDPPSALDQSISEYVLPEGGEGGGALLRDAALTAVGMALGMGVGWLLGRRRG